MTTVTAGRTTTPVINQIEELVADVPGWTPIDQLFTLFQLAYSTANLPGDIVEIGSWCGRSAVALGLAARLSGAGKVHCVDLFPEKDDWIENPDGSYSFRVTIDGRIYHGYKTHTCWREPFERDIVPLYRRNHRLLDLFRSNVAKHQLQDVIAPHKGTSETFVRSIPDTFRCRLAFLDGDHSYETVCDDIEKIERFLVPGGWICFDDAFSYYNGVNRAIEDRILRNPRFEQGQQMTRKLFIARKQS
jgi:predicted O-methyltransferase YrrM